MPQTIYMPQNPRTAGNIIAPAAQQTSNFLWNMLGQAMQNKYLMQRLAEQNRMQIESEGRQFERAKQLEDYTASRQPNKYQFFQEGQYGFDPVTNSTFKTGIPAPKSKESMNKASIEEMEIPGEPGRIGLFSIGYDESGNRVVGNLIGKKPKADEQPMTADQQANIGKGLMTQFRQDAKTYVSVRDSFARVMASGKDPSPAGDLALLFNYMKILDPGSVVRESEFANAENTGSIPQRIWARYNRVLEGERLSPQMRNDFLRRSEMLYKEQLRSYKKLENEFTKTAKNYHVPSNMVIIPYEMTYPELFRQGAQDNETKRLEQKYNLEPVQ